MNVDKMLLTFQGMVMSDAYLTIRFSGKFRYELSVAPQGD